MHSFLIDIEVHSFPAVQQDFAFPVSVEEHIVAAPSVETAACPAEALLAVGEGKEWGYKAFSLAEMVFGVLLIDTCNHPVEV